MKKKIEELLQLFKSENCDYERCYDLIREIGGCMQIVEARYGFKTTPLHLSIENGHYDFAIELIENQNADFNVSADCEPLIWELQYLDSETESEKRIESEEKLKIALALIRAGANPNPTVGSEELINYIRYKISDDETTPAEAYHYWEFEHIVDNFTNNKT